MAGSSIRRHNELATRGVRAERGGAKLSARAIATRGVESNKAETPRTRPLARDASVGRMPLYRDRKEAVQRARSHPRKELRRRETAIVVRGVRIVHGRARGVFRLQKSTGGARRFALDGVNLRRARSGLARSCASIGERRSVGSWIAAAKPRDQWRARTDHRASGLRTCTRRWKSLWVVGTATVRKRLSKCSRSPLTRGRERSGPWRRRCRTLSGNGGATESDRGVCRSTVHAVENAAVREHRPERYSALRFEEIVGNRPEARWASSNAHRPGAVSILAPQSVRDRKGAGRRKREGRAAPAVR